MLNDSDVTIVKVSEAFPPF
nr:hypothetical protein [Tanacetum cinerariifolium]